MQHLPGRQTGMISQPACLVAAPACTQTAGRLWNMASCKMPIGIIKQLCSRRCSLSACPPSTPPAHSAWLHPQITYPPATAMRSPAPASSTLLVTPEQDEVVCSTDLDEDGNCPVFVDRKGNMVEVSCRVLLSCCMHLLCGSHPPEASNVVPASLDCRRCAATTGSAATVAACTRRAMGRYQIQLSSW